MKPSFALNITDTTIGLLHRTARGWLQVGETAFDTADLTEALGYLRGSALGLSPGGLTTKLVIPNSQIKYLELEAIGPTDTDRRNQIRAALVGRTPYNVEDLVFDWSGTGNKVQVAVVARETLEEAEAFATEHRFNPVSFVGVPPKGDFKGEPWFGPSKLSTTVLEKGEKVDRDAEPVQVAARDLPKSHSGAAKTGADMSGGGEETADNGLVENDKSRRALRRAAAEQARLADAAAEAALVAAPAPAAAEVVPAIDPVIESIAAASPDATKADAPEVSPAPAPEPLVSAPVPETPVIAAFITDSPAFPEVFAPGAVSSEALAAKDDVPPAPSAAIMAAFASRRATNEGPGGKRLSDPVPDQPIPRAALVGRDLADRLAGKSVPPPLSRPKPGGDADIPNAQPQSVTMAEPAVSGLESVMIKSAARPSSAFVTAPNIPGSRKRKSLPTGASAALGSTETRKSPTKPGGTFGTPKDRGKPRHLGLILTALLLLFLALIGAWSSFFLASDKAPAPGTAVVSAPEATADAVVPAQEIAAETPAVDDEMLADSQDPADFATQGPADADVDPAAELPAADPAATVQADTATDLTVSAADAPPVAAPDPAPVGIAVTESPTAAPLNEAQDEIFLAQIDAPPLSLDPLALPQPGAVNDSLPLPQLEPPPFGTVYQFDADGRIRPTPEGIITPEGVRLVAGKPSLIPPPRPETLTAAAAPATSGPTAAPATDGAILQPDATAAAPVPFPSDPALAEARPRSRPENLAVPASKQAGDGASLEARNPTRVSGLRPQPRPAIVLAAGEAARQSTAAASLTAQAEQSAAVEAAVQASFQPDPNSSPLAVAVSRKPAPRPKDMSRAVEAAVAAAVRVPEPQAEEAHAEAEADAEPETASAAPAIPTRASVAKQATFVNAINLSKINLIGVYGTKSSRYALIRQANGRYKKVRVGDTIDGGKVAAINTDELRYQKSGRMVSLKLPKT